MISLRTYALVALPLAVVGATAAAGPASAAGTAHGGGAVTAAGSCSAASTWKLKAKVDNAKVEVEFQVDSNKVGQSWTWTLADDGTAVARGTSVTRAPSGSFTVVRRIANRAGTDVVRFTAKHAGETCTGSVRV